MKTLLLSSCLITLSFQAETPETKTTAIEEKKKANERLTLMKKAATRYRMTLNNQPMTLLKLKNNPILRWSNPVSDVKDGTVFIWTASGRPEAAAQFFLNRDRWWVHEFQSLSRAPLTAEMNQQSFWSPATGGVVMKPVPNAPVPAKSAVKRLLQIRAIAKTFSASVHFKVNSQNKKTARYQLRLLSNPVHRYGTGAGGVQDGALLAFVLGTDPEVWLLLESRADQNKSHQWYFALAPMTGYEAEASQQGKQIWHSPPQTGPRKPKSSYWIHSFPPAKPEYRATRDDFSNHTLFPPIQRNECVPDCS